MAVINYYDNILDKVSYSEESKPGNKLADLVDKYLETKEDYCEKFECYNSRTGETTYKTVKTKDYKVAINVNNREETLEYRVHKDDVVNIVFIPQGSDTGDAIAEGLGIAAIAIGAMIMPEMLAAGIAVAAIGAISTAIGAIDNYSRNIKNKKVNYDGLESNSLLSIRGGSNSSILNNKYPVVFGEHLINPNIIGSPYHETHINDMVTGKDNGQYFKALYCLGTGPLKLTNFKIGTTMLAYNTLSTDGKRQPILHGMLRLDKDWICENIDGDEATAFKRLTNPDDAIRTDNDTFDILKKWKNNDVKLEILQFGDISKGGSEISDISKYGTIYNQSVDEEPIDATLLFAYDKEFTSIDSVVYKNVEIPNGFRTNTVKLSHSCPMKIQVELDAPNGIYATRSSTESQSITQYKQLPLNIAVQWRFAANNETPSNAESPDGWHNFDYMVFDSGNIEANKYNDVDRKKEINSNKGIDKDTKYSEMNSNWLEQPVFHLTPENEIWINATDEDIVNFLDRGYITEATEKGEFSVDKYKLIDTYPYAIKYPAGEQYTKYIVNSDYTSIIRFDEDSVPPVLKYKNSVTEGGWISRDKYKEDNNGKDFNIKERRYVFEKVFTEEECRILSGYTPSNYFDKVEVRVIRLTPCYIDQSISESNAVSPESYQDLLKWTYLRTWIFDKEKYLNALKEVEDVSVENYKSKPFSEDDLKRFTYVALEMKQDVSETGGSSLEQLSCIAQSFSPKYNATENKWYPEEINETVSYYKKLKNEVTGKWYIEDITKEEYELNKGQDNYFWHRSGTDYLQRIREDICNYSNIIEDKTVEKYGLVKYGYSDLVESRYISNNTASVALQALFGTHLKEYAKTWNNVNKGSFADAYLFYKDVTDKTKETYSQDEQFVTEVNVSSLNRKVTGKALKNKGWGDTTQVENAGFFIDSFGDTDVMNGLSFICNGNEKTWVVTPIISDNILTPEQLRDVITLLNEDTPPSFSAVLACISGSQRNSRAELYAGAFKYVQNIYYEHKDDFSGFFSRFIDIPVNAMHRGCYDDDIFEFMDSYISVDGLGIPHIYKDMVIVVLEQMKCFAASDGLLHVSFKANGILSKDKKLETLLNDILVTGRSYLKRNDFNQYEPLIGRPNPYPVTAINQRVCISKGNSRTFEDTPSGFLVSFTDKEDDYGINELYVMDNGEDWNNPKKRIDDFNLEYVTDRYQIASLALFNLACKLYQRESYTRAVGRLGMNITIGDTVLLQDDSLLVGTDNGARIVEVLEDADRIYGFITDEVYEFTGENQGVTIVQPEKYGDSRCVTLKLAKEGDFRVITSRFEEPDQSGSFSASQTYYIEKGYSNVVLFSKAVNKNERMMEDADSHYVVVQPQIGDLVIFGKINSITEKVVVTGIKPNKNNYELTLSPYNEMLYNAGEEIPVFKPNMTIPQRDNENFAFTDLDSKAKKNEDDSNLYNNLYDKIQSGLNAYKSATIQLYKYSDTVIENAGISSLLRYYFESKQKEWIDADSTNGWKFTVQECIPSGKTLSEVVDKIYVTQATVMGNQEYKDIGTEQWSTPSTKGKNGVNTASIYLYHRGVSASKLTANLNYNFITHTLERIPEGWSLDTGNSNNGSLWVTIATASSSEDEDIILSTEWTEPKIMVENGEDGGYQDYVFVAAPFNTTEQELRTMEWSDTPPALNDGECLYMATAYKGTKRR